MKEIKAFVRPERLADIIANLRENGFCCVTVFEGEGTGHYVDTEKAWPSLNHPFLHSKVSKMEIVVPDHSVDEAIRIIHEYGNTGHPGDGLIYTTEVSNALRVRDLSADIHHARSMKSQ